MKTLKTFEEKERVLLTKLGAKDVDEKVLQEKLREQDERYKKSLNEAQLNNQRLGKDNCEYDLYIAFFFKLKGSQKMKMNEKSCIKDWKS